ncbi:hypothetical protein L1999_10540 [Neobacillus drentensis]|uniref:hypothetical protein n=1 Tax=Neobacillus drentensis TaxID=220684 RepID=UPI001F40CA09|nr:hypothetical protein [Neobacillus drentensis]ULT58929.1 hypothetical protein L1999_10540 [Neobacillus drentensis]
MRLSDVLPKKNFSYIFVQFPGMKMNVPMLSNGEGKAVKEDVALCVQLDSKEKLNQLYFVRTQSIKPFDFTAEGIGAKASYRVIKQKENSQDSHLKEPDEFVTVITDEVEIVQKKTDTGYNFVLVLNNREIGLVASVEAEGLQPVKDSMHHKEKAVETVNSIMERKIIKTGLARRAKQIMISGGHLFQDQLVREPIRILLEGVKRKVAVFSPAALDFIGPGDQNQTILIKRGW